MVRQIPLTKGYVALVDEGDIEALSRFNWHVHVAPNTCYAKRSITVDGKPRQLPMPNEILGVPCGSIVDHRDGNGLNNCRSNLRPANSLQNGRNKKPGSHNRSGCRGVSPDRGHWRASLSIGGTAVHVGTFDTAEEAARAYDASARLHYGEFARPNFPEVDDPPAPRRITAARTRAPRPPPKIRVSATGFRGIDFDRSKNRWRAGINVAGSRHRVGWFRTPQEAAAAYDRLARKFLGDAAVVNFSEAA